MKQLKIVSTLAILTLLLTSPSIFSQEKSSNKNTSEKSKQGMVYQCPVDMGVISNVPGNCSKCGRKLEELTLDEAINNLSGGGTKKPELKNKKIYSGKRDKSEKDEISNVAAIDNLEEEGLEKESEVKNDHKIIVSSFDLNRDGKVYQCTMCPDQLSDESDNKCGKCNMELVKISVVDAQNNLPK